MKELQEAIEIKLLTENLDDSEKEIIESFLTEKGGFRYAAALAADWARAQNRWNSDWDKCEMEPWGKPRQACRLDAHVNYIETKMKLLKTNGAKYLKDADSPEQKKKRQDSLNKRMDKLKASLKKAQEKRSKVKVTY